MIKYIYIWIISISIGVVIGIIILIPSIERPFEIIELQDTKCLDGTNYQFLYSKGEVNKFLIYFQGGGLCGTDGKEFLESCVERTKTELGSSKYFNYFITHVVSRYTRLFSKKESYNPQFYNWNKVYVKYCDGMLFSGNVDAPIKTASGVELYFNGEKNVKKTIEYLQKNYEFSKAEDVIITGSSAGGMGACMWGNYIRNKLTKPDNAYIINDSGFPLDYVNNSTQSVFKDLLQAMLKSTESEKYFASTELLKTYCPEESAETMWKCYLPQYYIHKIIPPMLLLHSPYDLWMQVHLAGIDCMQKSFRMLNNCNDDEKKVLAAYATKFTEIVTHAQKERKTNLSLWLPNTFTHTFMIMVDNWDNEAWYIDETEYTFLNVIQNWTEIAKRGESFLYQDAKTTKMSETYIKDKAWWAAYLKAI